VYKGHPTFLTVRYGIGHIHYKTTGNDTEIKIQWTDADGNEQIKPIRTERGAKRMLSIAGAQVEAALLTKVFDLGFEVKKDTESDYYLYAARFWVEDSPATFDTQLDAARACVKQHGAT
jgi:hypothetical protein